MNAKRDIHIAILSARHTLCSVSKRLNLLAYIHLRTAPPHHCTFLTA